MQWKAQSCSNTVKWCSKSQLEKLISCHNWCFIDWRDLEPSLLWLVDCPRFKVQGDTSSGVCFRQHKRTRSFCWSEIWTVPYVTGTPAMTLKIYFFLVVFNKEWASGEYLSSCLYQKNAFLCEMWGTLTGLCHEAYIPLSQIHSIGYQEIRVSLKGFPPAFSSFFVLGIE